MTRSYAKFFDPTPQNSQSSQSGYPLPGPQEPDAATVVRQSYFVDDAGFEALTAESFDFIVVGTGPTGVAFVERTLKNNPHSKILVLDRGGYFLPAHFQMMPPAFSTTGSAVTTYPWSRTTKMATEGLQLFQAGYIPLVGGRSTYWSAWSPSPGPELMRDWPEALVQRTRAPDFWERARSFLHVTSTAEIDDGVYGELQLELGRRLQKNLSHIASADSAFPAPIAVDNPGWKTVKFYKYATVGTLLELYQRQQARAQRGSGSPLTLVDRATVTELVHDDSNRVIALETTRGPLAVKEAKVILAMGTIPPATLLLNSFGDHLPHAGKRYTGHFMSHFTARVPRAAYPGLSELEIAAMYVEGHGKNGLQYHVQVSAFSATDPQSASLTFDHEAPDAAAAPSPQQLTGSQDHVVFVCATLGEIGENNASNWIAPDGRRDPTTNIRLQLLLGPQELELWDTLDEATEQTIVAMALGPDGKAPNVEYWSDEGEGGWGGDPPEPAERRLNIIVHEASPLWMGTDPDCSVVDTNFRPHGVPNVYVTGGAIFPTSGSWNPTLTMCGLAQSLADELS